MLKTSVFPCPAGKNGPFLSGKRREFNVDKMWKLLKMFGFSGLSFLSTIYQHSFLVENVYNRCLFMQNVSVSLQRYL